MQIWNLKFVTEILMRSTTTWLSWNGYRTLWKTHSQRTKTFKPFNSSPPPQPPQSPKPRKPPPPRKPRKTRRSSTTRRLSRERPAASAHAPPPVTGPRASSTSSLPATTPTPSLPKRRRRRRSGKARAPTRVRTLLAGSASTARRRRRRSGGLGPWARRRCVTRVGSGTSRVGWCPSTDPRRARRSCRPGIRIRTGRFWSCGGRRSFRGRISTSF